MRIQTAEFLLEVLKKRYFLKDEDGNPIEDWGDLCWRVANYIAVAEKTRGNESTWASKFFDVMYNLDFLPNSPTLRNAGS